MLHGCVNPGIQAQVVSLCFVGPCAIILLREFRRTHNDTVKHISGDTCRVFVSMMERLV